MSSGPRPPGAPRAETSENRWQLAFAIVMLLLFALFLTLYSGSKRETARLERELEQARSEPPKLAKAPESAPPAETTGARGGGANAELQATILSEARSFLSAGGGAKAPERPDVEVLDLASGDFLVRIAAPDLFPAGDARIAPGARKFVDRLGELIVKSGRRLRIEGHADFDDSEAISRKASAFANTWELSAARSAAVAQYWMRKFDLDPAKMESAAFGKYRPLEAKVGRPPQANRRLEVVILRVD